MLDVGCGQGFLLECARQFGIPSVGLEGSERALEKCRELHPLVDARLWHGGETLPLDSASVGGAVLNEFVDHIFPEQNDLLFRELQRVLLPGGVIIVKSPSRHNRFDIDQGHVTFFSPSEFRAFVESHGFDVISQPFVAQPLLGPSAFASRLVRLAAKVVGKEKIAARIDLVARKNA
ncbi:class I SAM-dependent methyltransferase [Prosthecobacter sp.]|uniref:class I SAM-dependent methyltransferase n=1 Tax=Prosthecobacter sp. TaxID=1965333 RepID=UPI002AB90448|nr:class I SAM-dependent methyltransferase [Prosthecobacter sp.]MDZ4401097.1 class I SAM-dependent methyltransferase [Prosthecobacter sp.]